ncbi:MAG: sigma-70 family RNA polymerase sigma factor [Ruminococcus sp.]|nr:sigma-70 family RNA polymerase sigma factor [Ruminococcus sp.]
MNNGQFDNAANLYYRSIYNYCLVRLNDSYAAQDCTQETFFIFYKKINKLDEENIRGWLYRTADNVIKNYNKKSVTPISDEEADKISVNDIYSEDMPFEEILKPNELKMLTEHYVDGYDISEVAEKNGKSAASVYKMFQRLKLKLKNYYPETC